ncbi:MAG: hypothetical protein O3A63_09250 [Proteobacteria bacterium]|nr:hypothetical protein [Pseudomonadota bacterium]
MFRSLICALVVGVASGSAQADVARTSDGRPDLSGNYNVATLTPLQRPQMFGDSLYLTKEQADGIASQEKRAQSLGSQQSSPERDAPPDGGDGSPGAAGNVGGYNSFWIDRGEDAFAIDGKFRTSIIFDPANGQRPAPTEAAAKAFQAQRRLFRPNKGDAWWLAEDETGPYDDPELRPLAERCLLGFGSTAGPPMLPVLYNNLKRIVQTPDHVVILNEMNHDARVVRIDGEAADGRLRQWLGDSVGRWEGDTLVVHTRNFRDQTSLGGGTRDLEVIERFTAQEDGSLIYNFTVNDPNTWTAPWSGEYLWPATQDVVYEYACHEGNYALGNIMRGARILEADVQGQTGR